MIKREDADRMIDEIFESSKDNDDDEKEWVECNNLVLGLWKKIIQHGKRG